jgi:hypothetical protein
MKELIRQLKNVLHTWIWTDVSWRMRCTHEYELMKGRICTEDGLMKGRICTEDGLMKGRMHWRWTDQGKNALRTVCLQRENVNDGSLSNRMLMMAVCRMWMPLQWQSGTVCYCIIINQWMSLINHSKEWVNGMLLYNQWMSRINHGKERVNGTEQSWWVSPTV